MPTELATTFDDWQPDADRPPGARSAFGRLATQIAHRALSLSLILLAAGTAAAAAGKSAAPLLLWAFAAGDVALLAGFLSLASDRRRGLAGREALLAASVAGGVAAVAMALYFVFRTRGV